MNAMEMITNLLDIENYTKQNLSNMEIEVHTPIRNFNITNMYSTVDDNGSWKINVLNYNYKSNNDFLSEKQRKNIADFLNNQKDIKEAKKYAKFLLSTLDIKAVYGWEGHYNEWFVPTWYDYETHEDWLESLRYYG